MMVSVRSNNLSLKYNSSAPLKNALSKFLSYNMNLIKNLIKKNIFISFHSLYEGCKKNNCIIVIVIGVKWCVMCAFSLKCFFLNSLNTSLLYSLTSGADTAGVTGLLHPSEISNSFSIALKGKQTQCKTEKISIFKQISPESRLLVPKSEINSEINVTPPSRKSCIRPCLTFTFNTGEGGGE